MKYQITTNAGNFPRVFTSIEEAFDFAATMRYQKDLTEEEQTWFDNHAYDKFKVIEKNGLKHYNQKKINDWYRNDYWAQSIVFDFKRLFTRQK